MRNSIFASTSVSSSFSADWRFQNITTETGVNGCVHAGINKWCKAVGMTPQIGWLHRIFRSSSAGSLLRLQASVNHAANVQCRSVFNKLPSACTIYFSTATSSRKLLVCQHEHSGYRNFTRSTTAYQNAKAEKLAADQLIKKVP